MGGRPGAGSCKPNRLTPCASGLGGSRAVTGIERQASPALSNHPQLLRARAGTQPTHALGASPPTEATRGDRPDWRDGRPPAWGVLHWAQDLRALTRQRKGARLAITTFWKQPDSACAASTRVVHRLADVEQSGMRLVPCDPTGARQSKQDRPGQPPRGVWQSEKGKPTSKPASPRAGHRARPPSRHAAQRIVWFPCVYLVRAENGSRPAVGRAVRDSRLRRLRVVGAISLGRWARCLGGRLNPAAMVESISRVGCRR